VGIGQQAGRARVGRDTADGQSRPGAHVREGTSGCIAGAPRANEK
jgi:hypothetical protein